MLKRRYKMVSPPRGTPRRRIGRGRHRPNLQRIRGASKSGARGVGLAASALLGPDSPRSIRWAGPRGREQPSQAKPAAELIAPARTGSGLQWRGADADTTPAAGGPSAQGAPICLHRIARSVRSLSHPYCGGRVGRGSTARCASDPRRRRLSRSLPRRCSAAGVPTAGMSCVWQPQLRADNKISVRAG